MTAPRCRPGDLAYVVGRDVKTPHLEGRFVVVERLAIDGEVVCGMRMVTMGYTTWICRSAASGALLPALTQCGELAQVERRHIADCILRPVRPNDGEDGTLAWAAPRGVTAQSTDRIAEVAP